MLKLSFAPICYPGTVIADFLADADIIANAGLGFGV
jgi:hypothetical protein